MVAPRVEMEAGLEALVEDARKLLALDPCRFFKLLALCRAYVSIYESPEETLLELLVRLRAGKQAKDKASA